MTDATAPASEPKIRPAVFISYRRSDTQAWAGRIADFLTSRSNLDILFDVDTISRGLDYTKEIAVQVARADAVLVIIGPTWLTVAGDDGTPRIGDPADAVRQEVAAALAQEKVVVPVLVDGARVPASNSLPPDIAALAFRNGLTLNHESFRQDLAHLVVDLRAIGARLLSENPAIAAATRYAPVAARNVSEGLVKFGGSLADRYERRKQARLNPPPGGHGASAQPATGSCSSCQNPVGPQDAFCGYCGTKTSN